MSRVPTTPLAAVTASAVRQREWALGLVDGLTDEQLAWRPSPTAHSIGWTLWHIARADDNAQRDITAAAATIWKEGGYRERWGFSTDQMTRMEDAAAAAMPMPRKDELLSYVRAAFAAMDASVSAVTDEQFNDEVESRFYGRRAAVGEICVGVLGHDGRHLGEMEYIKGLLGLRGTVTV